MSIDLSVIVPVAERASPLHEVYHEYAPAIRAGTPQVEFIFVVDPRFQRDLGQLRKLAASGEPIRIFVTGQTLGETALLNLGVDQARADRILTLPPYFRIQPGAIPLLLQALEEGDDMVVARRFPRRDSWVNRLQNRVFHVILNRTAGGNVRDVACGVRAIRKQTLLEIPLYGDFGRFLPILAAREGYKVREIETAQHPRDAGPRVYAPGVYVRRLLDVLAISFLLRFTQKPLRFFGLLGGTAFIAGFAILVVVGVQRLQGQELSDRPLLLLGLLGVVLGVQAIALGLIGEIIVHLQAPRHPTYRLVKGE